MIYAGSGDEKGKDSQLGTNSIKNKQSVPRVQPIQSSVGKACSENRQVDKRLDSQKSQVCRNLRVFQLVLGIVCHSL